MRAAGGTECPGIMSPPLEPGQSQRQMQLGRFPAVPDGADIGGLSDLQPDAHGDRRIYGAAGGQTALRPSAGGAAGPGGTAGGPLGSPAFRGFPDGEK